MPALPDTMTLIGLDAPGGPEALRPERGPLPRPRPGELLVRVLAAGVNRPDVQQRRGAYPPPPDASPVLGLEVAGEVVALGEGTQGFAVGERVCGLANGGGYAQYCALPAGQCLRWPRGYDAVRAAALPECFFTVWANLVRIGRLAAGEVALVHGGSSGIGTTAIQVAKELGARILVTAGTPEKCEACVRLGADAAINHRAADFVHAVREFTAGRGVDVILDMVAGDYTPRNLKALAIDGRLVLIAFLNGSKVPELDLTPIMTRRLTVTGSTMRPRTAAQKAAIAADLRERIWPALDAGRCAPVIHAVLPLEQAAQAHALMEGGEHIGKIVLEVAHP